MELHSSLTLIPVIQRSTILSCGVTGIDRTIKRQVICLSVAANQDSPTWHHPFSDILLNILNAVLVHNCTIHQTNKNSLNYFKYSCDWIFLAQWNELISLSCPKGKKKRQHCSGTPNWLKHLKSLSKIRNKSFITIYPLLGIYTHQKWRVKPATILIWLKKVDCHQLQQQSTVSLSSLAISLWNMSYLLFSAKQTYKNLA